MRKEELRQQIQQIKRQFTPQQLEELSLPVVVRLRERLKDAKTIVAYYPLPDEVDIRQLLDEWLAEGKTIFLPKVTGPVSMELCRFMGRDDLQEGAFHILEPSKNHGDRSIDMKSGDFNQESVPVILVPGVAFDVEGHRLGRGKGYYDHFLRTREVRTIGVCFDFQKVSKVPVDAYDIAVDEVI